MSPVADLLEAKLDALLKQWIARVGASLAPGRRTNAELADYIPAFLQQVIATLREPTRHLDTSPVDGRSDAGREHGAQRFRLGFELEAVVREYGLLFHIVLDLIEAEGAAVSIRDVRRLNDLITNAVAEATAEYARRLDATGQTATTRQAERLKAQLETTLHSMGDGVLATDSDGLVMLLNPAAEELTGWPVGEALGQPVEAVLTLIDATTRAALPSPFAAVLRGEPPARLRDQILLVRRDGGTIAFADSLAAIRDGAGAIVGAVLVFRDETEVRRKDSELRIFRAVLDASNDFIAFGRPGGRPEYVNAAGLRLVGLDSQEAASALPIDDYYTPESRDATIAAMIQELRAGRSFQGKAVMRHFGTGEAIPVSQAAFAVHDASGRPIVLATVIRDRREQERAEAERERLLADAQAARRETDLQREHLASAFNQAPVAVGILRGERDIVTLANPAICRIWGHTHAQLIQRPIFDLLVEAKGQGFPELLAQVRATGEPCVGREVPVSLPRLDGGGVETVLLNFVYQPLRAGDGSITDILVVATDVTAEVQARRAAEASSAEFEAMFNNQRRTLEALHRSEESLRTLAEAIPQQVWTALPSGALDFVNQRVLSYFAATQEEVLGAGWQAVIHADDLPRAVERWTRSLATGEEYDVEFRLRLPDGTYRWHLGRALASRDTQGEVVKWFGTNTDIDEAKKVREELEKRTEFEQHLLGIVSHDLRNPLTAIGLSATTLLQMKEPNERVTKIARRIHSSAERSSRMISDLLDFTQARLGGGIQLEWSPADLYTLTSTTVEEVETAYPDRDIELIQVGDTNGTWDADRIVQ
ncbi:MAG: PAS domain S-box protein, partial [Byssovorax sp.]